MYYKSVNRGLTFTKPGLYSIMFVMAIGMLAIVSGVNGLYLFLSAGLAALIVSGLLSERTIKSFAIKKIEDGMFEAGKPQHVKLVVQNLSSKFYLNGVDAFIVDGQPRFRLLKRDPKSFMSLRVQRLGPNEQVTVNALSNPMKRAYYRSFKVYYRTEYPFGLLEKFKITDVESNVIVAPEVDEKAYGNACDKIRQLLRKAEEEQEFYSHRSYMPRDSLKLVDWRRSASRPPSAWVVKRYVAERQLNRIVVVVDWAYLTSAVDDEEYEKRVSIIYSVLKGIHHVTVSGNYCLGLSFDQIQVIWGFESTAAHLAELPRRSSLKPQPEFSGVALPNEYVAMHLGEDALVLAVIGKSA